MDDTSADTAPDAPPSPESLDGYEPPVDGESQRDKRNRKARNRRRAEKVTTAAAAETAPASTGGRPRKATKRAESVTGIVAGVGIAVMAFNDADGRVIIDGAADLGQALSDLADKNPRVARALDALNETSAWAGVAIAVGGIVVPIVKNHGLLDAKPKTEQVSTPAARESNTQPNTDHGDGWAADDPAAPFNGTIRRDAAGGLVFAARPDA